MSERVYVMELQYGEAGYISVDRTYEGARAKLEQRCDDWGIRDLLDAAEEVGDPDGCVAAGEDGDELTYGISCLEIEP